MTTLMERRDIEAPAAALTVAPEPIRFAQVLSRVAQGALPRERRLQIGFDARTGDYHLGVAEQS